MSTDTPSPSELDRLRAELAAAQARYQRLIDHLGTHVTVLDLDATTGRVLRASEGFPSIFGRPVDNVVGQPLTGIEGWPDAVPLLARDCGDERAVEVGFHHPDGDTRYLVLRAYSVPAGAGDAVLEVVVEDITAQRRAENRLRDAATTDALTRTASRAAVLARLPVAVDHPPATGAVCVVLLDIDHFDALNKSRGHAAGDAVLQALASRVRRYIRPTDLPGRYGDDVFLLLISGMTLTQATERAERIRRAVERMEVPVAGTMVRCTVSIGVASTEHASTADQLLAQAEGALRAAKDGRRNRVVPACGAA